MSFSSETIHYNAYESSITKMNACVNSSVVLIHYVRRRNRCNFRGDWAIDKLSWHFWEEWTPTGCVQFLNDKGLDKSIYSRGEEWSLNYLGIIWIFGCGTWGEGEETKWTFPYLGHYLNLHFISIYGEYNYHSLMKNPNGDLCKSLWNVKISCKINEWREREN